MSGNIQGSVQFQPWLPKGPGRLQCPWSKCFPHLYRNSEEPCAISSFEDFRQLNDHIWKYHSNLLSCKDCDHRFTNAKRTKDHMEELEEMKRKHAEKCHGSSTGEEEDDTGEDGRRGQKKEKPKRLKHSVQTMTPDHDVRFRSWQDMCRRITRGQERLEDTNQNGPVVKYKSLCECLFDNSFVAPTNPYYDFLFHKQDMDPNSGMTGGIHVILAEVGRSRTCMQQQEFDTGALPAMPESYPQPDTYSFSSTSAMEGTRTGTSYISPLTDVTEEDWTTEPPEHPTQTMDSHMQAYNLQGLPDPTTACVHDYGNGLGNGYDSTTTGFDDIFVAFTHFEGSGASPQ
ncbi:hypothetical protein F4677DRAFT_156204 [Hypoxylon crocopeplum]|nr:hypothetical protein F4677DRAFT_156204 [Hypoxylon crocopeplum]